MAGCTCNSARPEAFSQRSIRTSVPSACHQVGRSCESNPRRTTGDALGQGHGPMPWGSGGSPASRGGAPSDASFRLEGRDGPGACSGIGPCGATDTGPRAGTPSGGRVLDIGRSLGCSRRTLNTTARARPVQDKVRTLILTTPDADTPPTGQIAREFTARHLEPKPSLRGHAGAAGLPPAQPQGRSADREE